LLCLTRQKYLCLSVITFSLFKYISHHQETWRAARKLSREKHKNVPFRETTRSPSRYRSSLSTAPATRTQTPRSSREAPDRGRERERKSPHPTRLPSLPSHPVLKIPPRSLARCDRGAPPLEKNQNARLCSFANWKRELRFFASSSKKKKKKRRKERKTRSTGGEVRRENDDNCCANSGGDLKRPLSKPSSSSLFLHLRARAYFCILFASAFPPKLERIKSKFFFITRALCEKRDAFIALPSQKNDARHDENNGLFFISFIRREEKSRSGRRRTKTSEEESILLLLLLPGRMPRTPSSSSRAESPFFFFFLLLGRFQGRGGGEERRREV